MDLRQHILYEVAKVMLEIRTNFDMRKFKQLQTLEEMIQYADANLQKLGAGSARVVYLLSNRHALKIALPQAGEKGIGQNKGEVEVFTNPKAKPWVAAIQDADPQYRWLVSELARPMKSAQEFEEMAKVNWNTFADLVRNYKTWQEITTDQVEEYDAGIAKLKSRLPNADAKAKPVLTKKVQRLENAKNLIAQTVASPVFKGTMSLITDVGLMAGDLNEWDHWAKTADGRLILIDYGFTRDLIHLYKQAA